MTKPLSCLVGCKPWGRFHRTWMTQVMLQQASHLVDIESDRLQILARGTAATVNDVVEANSLLHGDETDVFGDEPTRRQA